MTRSFFIVWKNYRGRFSGANTQMTKCFLLSRENDFPLRMNNGIFAVQIFIFFRGINMHFMGFWSQAMHLFVLSFFCKNATQTCTLHNRPGNILLKFDPQNFDLHKFSCK
jgi:hypothetical protein